MQQIKLSKTIKFYNFSYTLFKTFPLLLLSIISLNCIAQSKTQKPKNDTIFFEGLVAPEEFVKKDVAKVKTFYNIVSKIDSTKRYNNTLLGVVDSFGNTILPTVFRSIEQSGNNYIVQLGESYSLFDHNMKPLLPFEYSFIGKTTNPDLFIFSKDQITLNKGITDIYGSEILPPKFYINSLKDMIHTYNSIDIKNENYYYVGKFEYGVFTNSIYNIETRKFLTGFDFTNIEFVEKYFLVTLLNGKQQFLDINLKVRNNVTFDFINKLDNSSLFIAKKDRKQGLIDIEGNKIIPIIYDSVFSDKHYIYCMSKKSISIFDKEAKKIKKVDATSIDYQANNYFKIGISNKYGLYDNKLDEVLPIKYDNINLVDYYNKYSLLVSENNKWGLLNLDKTQVLPIEYQNISLLYQYLLLKKNNKYGIFDAKENKMIQECDCDALAKKEHNGDVFICMKGKDVTYIKLKLLD